MKTTEQLLNYHPLPWNLYMSTGGGFVRDADDEIVFDNIAPADYDKYAVVVDAVNATMEIKVLRESLRVAVDALELMVAGFGVLNRSQVKYKMREVIDILKKPINL